MKLLPGEEKLLTSNEEKIILTNLRIQLKDKEWGSDFRVAIFLEEISAVETRYRSNLSLLVTGSFLLFLGLVAFFTETGTSAGNPVNAGTVMGILILLFWHLNRRYHICISSTGKPAIYIDAKFLSEEQIEHFLYSVQKAKAERIRNMHLPVTAAN